MGAARAPGAQAASAPTVNRTNTGSEATEVCNSSFVDVAEEEDERKATAGNSGRDEMLAPRGSELQYI